MNLSDNIGLYKMGLKGRGAAFSGKRQRTGCALIYLATPYSHEDATVREMRFKEVNKCAASLMGSGMHIFSPISHTHPIAVEGDLLKGWEFWEKYDRKMLASCDGVIVLQQDGWKESTGVQAEIKIAEELGIPVEYIEHNRGIGGKLSTYDQGWV